MRKINWMPTQIIVAMGLWLALSSAMAAPIPWKTDKYSHFSDQEPLSDVLKAIASFEDITIVVSPNVKDVVSLHFEEKPAQDLFKELVKSYGLVWYYNKEALYVYKEDEVQTASVSLKNMKPQEFTTALRRLQVLDDSVPWKSSEVDNVIYFRGPEKLVSAILDLAQVMDNQPVVKRKQIYRWRDKKGVVNFSSDDPLTPIEPASDVTTTDKFPGFDVVDVVRHRQ